MEWRLWSLGRIVQVTVAGENDQTCEPDTKYDKRKDASFPFFPQSMLCQIPLSSVKGGWSVSKSCPQPFSIVDVSTIDTHPKGFVALELLPFKSRIFPVRHKMIMDCECPPRRCDTFQLLGNIRPSVKTFLLDTPNLKIDKFNKSIRSWRRREGPVVVNWHDLKSVSECVFSKIKPLLVQLTLIAPSPELNCQSK
ncbi:hypothetical protein Tco_1125720 [Tanacetum coccineum]